MNLRSFVRGALQAYLIVLLINGFCPAQVTDIEGTPSSLFRIKLPARVQQGEPMNYRPPAIRMILLMIWWPAAPLSEASNVASSYGFGFLLP